MIVSDSGRDSRCAPLAPGASGHTAGGLFSVTDCRAWVLAFLQPTQLPAVPEGVRSLDKFCVLLPLPQLPR